MFTFYNTWNRWRLLSFLQSLSTSNLLSHLSLLILIKKLMDSSNQHNSFNTWLKFTLLHVIHVLLFYVTCDQHDQLVITHKCTELWPLKVISLLAIQWTLTWYTFTDTDNVMIYVCMFLTLKVSCSLLSGSIF